jgi:predicted helicase
MSADFLKKYKRHFDAFYEARRTLAHGGITHEMAVREPFMRLLEVIGKDFGWQLIREHTLPDQRLRPDATLDKNGLPRGYYEAKDAADDLEAEIARKFARTYPTTNIIFEDTRRAMLYQNGREYARADLMPKQRADLAALLHAFFTYSEPDFERYDQALSAFRERVPALADGLRRILERAHSRQPLFQREFQSFHDLCRTAINPNISRDQIDEMLIQHLLTERLIRKIFDNPDFAQRNVIAAALEQVIKALTSAAFSRDSYLHDLSPYYEIIEQTAHGLDFGQKQKVLNEVYERFFQGYSTKTADTHGIVYTPQEIVSFMCASVLEVLRADFGKTLADPDVVILDPCTGTGNFIVNLLERAALPPPALHNLYSERLFANEVLLMPYYIAALNIEHAFYTLSGEYRPFEGLCFVDTLEIAERGQLSYLTEANTERVERQKQAPITVIIGNPPYNAWQKSENDNNKNRRYPQLDRRIAETYARDSRATNKNSLYDPYVKFFRWAADRLGERDGIVAYVSNNSFIDGFALDGMRKHLLQDFTHIYHLDLGGNVRQNPKLSGTTHNVFGIRVGVGITIAVRRAAHMERRVFYHALPALWRKEEKLAWLAAQTLRGVPLPQATPIPQPLSPPAGKGESESDSPALHAGRGLGGGVTLWQPLTPDAKGNWLSAPESAIFETFLPMGAKDAKQARAGAQPTLFATYSGGIKTNRDAVVYDFQREALLKGVAYLVEAYTAELDRYKRAVKKGAVDIDNFVRRAYLKWDSTLKGHLRYEREVEFDPMRVRQALYRPFTKHWLYFDRLLINSVYLQHYFFPTPDTEAENRVICISDIAYRAAQPSALMTNCIADLHLCASVDGHQCFPFYTYAEDGTDRRENITDWALAQFQAHYGDPRIGKWDIFHYSYAALHSPAYRARFAAALKKDLPRIPFAADFWAYARAGAQLADLHVNYEVVTPYRLGELWSGVGNYEVEAAMRLVPSDGVAGEYVLHVNNALRLTGIPSAALDYKLGNRSALEWVIDQYRVKAGSNPNRADDPEYIVRLVKQVVQVSVETVRIIGELPPLFEDFED